MSLDGKGKLIPVGKAGTRYISIPAKIAGDSAFPFKDNEEVQISIHGDKLEVKKVK
jgi:hypothetical protein